MPDHETGVNQSLPIDTSTTTTDDPDAPDSAASASDLPPPRATAHVAVNASEDEEHGTPKAGWVATVDNWGGARVYIKNAYSEDSQWHTWRTEDIDWALSARPVLDRGVSEDTEYVLIRDTQRGRVEAYPTDCWNIRVPRDKTPDEQYAALKSNCENAWYDHADTLFPADPADTITGTIDNPSSSPSSSSRSSQSRRDTRSRRRNRAANDDDEDTHADRRERYEHILSIVDHHTWGPDHGGPITSPTMGLPNLGRVATGSSGIDTDNVQTAVRAAFEKDDLARHDGRVWLTDRESLLAVIEYEAASDDPNRDRIALCNKHLGGE